jgi:hypothetical protein
MSRRHPPLAPNGAAERATLRAQVAPEARRLALAQWWAGYSEEDARRELSTFLAAAAEKGGFRIRCRPIADEMMKEAGDLLWTEYAWTYSAMKDAMLDALGRGLSRAVAMMQACTVAAAADPQPPPQVVRQAVDDACRLHHWRRKQARAEVVA